VVVSPQELSAATCTTLHSGAWSTPSVWASGLVPQTGDTAIISIGDSVVLDRSTPALGALVVQGVLTFRADTLFLKATAAPFDTLVTVQGTLDADSGWFGIAGVRPIVHVLPGGLFRTAAVFPFPSPSMFDSSASPFFVLDVASTFEYYSGSNALTDVSYLMNNIIGHAYRNVTLTGMVASFRANPLVVLGTLHIGFGAATHAEYTPQRVTLSGDVVNDNQGQSGAPGAGHTGCGMLSLGNDTWIFDALPSGTSVKDTIHWSGPSQLGNVIVRPNTVLAVRFVDDTHCDSLDILTSLVEDAKPCGGHLIGRAFSEISVTLDSTHPIDSFSGLGLTIASGTNPYLGLTRVVRTSGYMPPNANVTVASSGVVPVLRYYRVTPGNGPQLGTPNVMTMQLHCDELNGAAPASIHFWRSLDQGNTWAFSGLTSYNLSSDLFTWDTTVLGWPNATGSFLWMLANGYTDSPLPAVLQDFSAIRSGSGVALRWQTSSENNIVGYEIDRESYGDSEAIASYWSDDSLRARSLSGANYHYMDASAPSGDPRYDLYEITDDGIRQWLGTRVALSADSVSQPTLESARYSSESLILMFNQPPEGVVSVVDAIGRTRLQKSFQGGNVGSVSLPVALQVGFYFISYRGEGGVVMRKLVVAE